MKTIKNLFLVTLLAIVATSCKNETKPEVKTVETETIIESAVDPDATYAKAEFTIEGMTCAVGCAKTIEKKLAKMEGVKSATVDYDKKLAMVEYDNAKVNTNNLEETVTKIGDMYTVKEMKTVESFTAKKACDSDCKKECCTNKSEKKMACATDCKKACCAKKEKA